MSYLSCPYCAAANEVIHDYGVGEEECVNHKMRCTTCNMYFVFQTVITRLYTPKKADCLNGKPHELYEVGQWFNSKRVLKRCKNCDHQELSE